MRIISKFQDYYDSIQKMYQHDHVGPTSEVKSVTSDNRPWVRNKRESSDFIPLNPASNKSEIDVPRIVIDRGWDTRTFGIRANIDWVVIGFCGKIYPAISFQWSDVENGVTINSEISFCYNIEDLDKTIEKLYSEKRITEERYKKYNKKGGDKRRNRGWLWRFSGVIETPEFVRTEIEAAFKRCKEKSDKFEFLFEKERTPVFSIKYFPKSRYGQEVRITYDDCLKDYQFYRVFDAMAAYQEIEMYFGNMCFPEPSINPVPDVINAESHGFNKFSFRKDPENKK